MMHKTLVDLAVRWLKRRCSIVFSEFATANNETPDAIGWKGNLSILIECKVSKSDFLKDVKKITRRNPEMGLGNRRYFLCPAGLLNIDDLPNHNWGLLWNQNGRIIVRQTSQFHRYDKNAEIRFLVSMLRRAQVRLGKQLLSEWLCCKNRTIPKPAIIKRYDWEIPDEAA